MRTADINITKEINEKLNSFKEIIPLPGIEIEASRNCFITQMIDSIRRISYVTLVRDKIHDATCADPNSIGFDPIKAAAWHKMNGDIDEAFWLVFLAIHCGKHLKSKWQLVKNLYGGMGESSYWTWQRLSHDPDEFRFWLDKNQMSIKQTGGFGNHRKYESLNAYLHTGTGEAISSYVSWIGETHNHLIKISNVLSSCDGDKRIGFASLYNSMDAVTRFGRTAKFDYLTMLGKLGLANIEPNSTYMNGATGPFAGARLLFGINANHNVLNELLNELESHLGLYFGMQVLEDAICNWQKNTHVYRHFSG